MSNVLSAVACNLDANILLASIPLFESEKVQAIEWSFDTLFQFETIPEWFSELVTAFSRENRLIGHGVFFSIFSGKWSVEHQNWLNHLEKTSKQYRFDHITEHFGFMTGADFHKGAPLSIPFNQTTLNIAQDRLKRIYQACQCPVGLENLAFSYSLDEVKRHGAFLEKIIEPINGFIILDLHNLYCQLHNFEVDFEEIIALYPLERVREIHVSGGSWEDSTLKKGKKIRRDTHDDSVPDAVFEILKRAVKMCPNLKFVVLEQLGVGLETEENRTNFQKDFIKLEAIVEDFNSTNTPKISNGFLPKTPIILNEPITDETLHTQQLQLSEILENAEDSEAVLQKLRQSKLANSDWHIEKWEPFMLETAMNIAQKWKAGHS